MARRKAKKSRGTPTPKFPANKADHPYASADGEAIRQFRDALNCYRSSGLLPGAPRHVSSWTREDAICLLRVIKKFIDSITTTVLPEDGSGLEVHLQHEATFVLECLIHALLDLDLGNVDPRLKPMAGQGGAALKASERRKIDCWLDAVEIIRNKKQISYSEAQSEMAKSLKKKKEKHREKVVTASMLKAWRKARLKKGSK